MVVMNDTATHLKWFFSSVSQGDTLLCELSYYATSISSALDEAAADLPDTDPGTRLVIAMRGPSGETMSREVVS